MIVIPKASYRAGCTLIQVSENSCARYSGSLEKPSTTAAGHAAWSLVVTAVAYAWSLALPTSRGTSPISASFAAPMASTCREKKKRIVFVRRNLIGDFPPPRCQDQARGFSLYMISQYRMAQKNKKKKGLDLQSRCGDRPPTPIHCCRRHSPNCFPATTTTTTRYAGSTHPHLHTHTSTHPHQCAFATTPRTPPPGDQDGRQRCVECADDGDAAPHRQGVGVEPERGAGDTGPKMEVNQKYELRCVDVQQQIAPWLRTPRHSSPATAGSNT